MYKGRYARFFLGSIASRCSGKELALLNELTAGLMYLALSILTNEISACLNRAGCINYLSRSSKEVVYDMASDRVNGTSNQIPSTDGIMADLNHSGI